MTYDVTVSGAFKRLYKTLSQNGSKPLWPECIREIVFSYIHGDIRYLVMNSLGSYPRLVYSTHRWTIIRLWRDTLTIRINNNNKLSGRDSNLTVNMYQLDFINHMDLQCKFAKFMWAQAWRGNKVLPAMPTCLYPIAGGIIDDVIYCIDMLAKKLA